MSGSRPWLLCALSAPRQRLSPSHATLRFPNYRQIACSPISRSATSYPSASLSSLPGRVQRVLPAPFSNKLGATSLSSIPLHYSSPPGNILIVKKVADSRTSQAIIELIQHLQEHYPSTRVILEPNAYNEVSANPSVDKERLFVVETSELPLLTAKTDLIITLGGDGTILHASSLFCGSAPASDLEGTPNFKSAPCFNHVEGPLPPVLSFSMGSLGFLLPFNFKDFKTALMDVFSNKTTVLKRMRLSATVHSADGEIIDTGAGTGGWQAMNEVNLHRGRHPHLTIVDAFVDGQFLTEAVADGILVCTPTGSTGYNLSLGGPIVHPLVSSLLLTPIAPRSLSFRPLMFPSTSTIELRSSSKSRAKVELTMDGRVIRELEKGESVRISMAHWGLECVERGGSASGVTDGWVGDINSLLKFNTGFINKGLIGGPDSDLDLS